MQAAMGSIPRMVDRRDHRAPVAWWCPGDIGLRDRRLHPDPRTDRIFRRGVVSTGDRDALALPVVGCGSGRRGIGSTIGIDPARRAVELVLPAVQVPAPDVSDSFRPDRGPASS
ncbi:MAG: hypothetical protein CMJ52_02600 [Planctomycetaceae bacterium]|nr:hypothetical protein [Planctomycetaceae bacterium]